MSINYDECKTCTPCNPPIYSIQCEPHTKKAANDLYEDIRFPKFSVLKPVNKNTNEFISNY